MNRQRRIQCCSITTILTLSKLDLILPPKQGRNDKASVITRVCCAVFYKEALHLSRPCQDRERQDPLCCS